MSKQKPLKHRVTPPLWVALPPPTKNRLTWIGNQTGLTREEVANLLVEPNPSVKFQAIRDSLHAAWENRRKDLAWRNSPTNLDWVDKHPKAQADPPQP